MHFRETISICSENHNKLIKGMWQNEEFLSLLANGTEI
jgi:hypothetical protein